MPRIWVDINLFPTDKGNGGRLVEHDSRAWWEYPRSFIIWYQECDGYWKLYGFDYIKETVSISHKFFYKVSQYQACHCVLKYTYFTLEIDRRLGSQPIHWSCCCHFFRFTIHINLTTRALLLANTFCNTSFDICESLIPVWHWICNMIWRACGRVCCLLS